MSNTIDNRVVEMQFDNAAFEKGVKQTTDSLQNLDKTIAATAKNTEKSSFGSALSKLAGNISNILPTKQITGAVSAVGSAVSSIFSNTFDAIGTASKVGLASIAGIGAAVTGLAASGGLTRALNLEQAQFQLKGLGVAWEQIYDDLDYAVAGTAYGLDSAAKAASQLVASNVQVGDSMKTALRGISGVAAMTNREYDEVAHIFTTVAGNGRLMGQQLTQLSSYGLNVAAELGKQLGYTEAEIRDMASKGQISFEQFATAMDNAFGEHAKAANETFTGAMSNVKAALSRIGAEFWLPLHESLRKVFVELIPVINIIKKSLTPVIDAAAKSMDRAQEFIGGILRSISTFNEESGGLVTSRLWSSFSNFIGAGKMIAAQFAPLKNIFGDVFNIKEFNIDAITSKLEQFSLDIFNFVYKNEETFGAFARGISNIFKPILSGLKEAGETITGFFNSVLAENPIKSVISTFDEFGTLIEVVERIKGPWTVLDQLMKNLSVILDNLSPILSEFINWWNKLANSALKAALPLFASFVELFANFSQKLNESFFSSGGPAESIGTFIDKLSSGVVDLVPPLEELGGGVDFLSEAFGRLLDKLKTLKPDLSGVKEVFAGIKESLFPANAEPIDFSFLDGLIDFVKNTSIKDVMSAITTGTFAAGLFGIIRVIRSVGQSIRNVFKGEKSLGLENLLGLDFSIFNRMANQLSYTFNSLTSSIKSNIILKIAAAILVFAAALKVLSSINPEQMISVSIALAEFVGVMAAMFKVMSAMSSSVKPAALFSMIFMLSALGSAMVKMSIAMKIMSSIDTSGMMVAIVGMLAVTAALSVLFMAIELLANTGKAGTILAAAVVFSQLGGMFLSLSVSMKILSSISPEALLPSIVGLLAVTVAATGLIFALGLFSKNTVNIISASSAFATLAVLFLAMTVSMKILSTIDSSAMTTATLGLISTVMALSLLIGVVGSIPASRILTGAFAIGNMGMMLTQLSVALKTLSKIEAKSLLKSIVTVYAVVGGLTAVIFALSTINPTKANNGVNGLLMMAVSLMLLAPAMKLISSIPVEGVITLLVSLGGAMLILGAAVKFIPAAQLIAFAVGLSAIAASALMFGAAAALFGVGLMTISVGLTTLLSVLGTIASDIANTMRIMAEAFVTFVVESAQKLAANTAPLISAGMKIMKDFLSGLATLIPEVVTLGVQTILSFLQGISDNMTQIVATAISIITNFLVGVASQIGAVIDAAMWVGIMFIKGLSDGVRENAEFVGMAVESLVQTIGSVLLGGLADILESNPLTAPLAGDIRGASEELGAAAAEASDAIQAKFDEKFGEIETNAGDMSSGIVSTLSAPDQYTPIGDGMAQGVESGFNSGISGIPTEFQGIMDQVNASMDDSASGAESKGTTLMQNFETGIDSSSGSMINTFTSAANKASDQAGSVDSKSDGSTVGSNFGSGIYYGMDSWMSSISSKAREMVRSAKSAANEEMAAASPSKDMMKSGGWFGEGFMIGIENMIRPVSRTAAAMTDSAKEQVTGFATMMGSLFDTIDWDANPVISPVLDTSMLQAGMASMYGMFGNPSLAYSASGFSMSAAGMPRVPIMGRSLENAAPATNITQIYIDGDLLRSDDDLRGLYEQWTMELNRRIMK